MIEIIHNIPALICGFLATGEVSASDYEQVLIPEIEARLKQTDKILFSTIWRQPSPALPAVRCGTTPKLA